MSTIGGRMDPGMTYGQTATQQDAWRSAAAGRIDRISHADGDCSCTVPRKDSSGMAARAEQTAAAVGTWLLQAAPGFLLSYADLLGMPSGLGVCWIVALGSCGMDVLPALAGCAASMAMRLVWGARLYPVTGLCVALAWLVQRFVRERNNLWLCSATMLAMLPLLIWALVFGTAEETLLCTASLAVSVLSAPVMVRALSRFRSGRSFDTVDVRISVGFLLCMLLCGCSRLLLGPVNLGVLGAAVFTCGMAAYCGTAAGMASGLCGGLVLALMELPPALSMCLAMGGMLCGVTQPMGKRWLSCLAFAGTAVSMLLCSGAAGLGCWQAVLAGPALLGLNFGTAEQWTRRFFHRFLSCRMDQGDAYASCALSSWEQTIGDMAQAIPCPRQACGKHDAAWWQQHLCGDCPEAANCGVMEGKLALERAESVWQHRHEDDEHWQQALEELRGLGCRRLYCLLSGMEHLRTEEAIRETWVRRACFQRDMLVTHLEAVSGAASRFAELASGESWWDERSTKRLRYRIGETALPADVLYVRRIQGHAAAAISFEQTGKADAYTEDACRLCSEVLGRTMQVRRLENGRLFLCEKPVYQVSVGLSGVSVDRETATGDAACTCLLPDGRLLAAMSDGMGQGGRAGEESALTVNLLRLCMEAGYTRSQTLTAVNGMMLLETGGERFATADLVTIDLWSGEATLDKLGAAGSWLLRGDTLAEITGDALPVGILETVENRASILRLREGDTMLLMTDGVEDAFADTDTLKDAIRIALKEADVREAADALLRAADRAKGGRHPDDRTVLVLRMEKAA